MFVLIGSASAFPCPNQQFVHTLSSPIVLLLLRRLNPGLFSTLKQTLRTVLNCARASRRIDDVSPAFRALLIGARPSHVDVRALRKSAHSEMLLPTGAVYRNLGGQAEDNHRGPTSVNTSFRRETVHNTTSVY